MRRLLPALLTSCILILNSSPSSVMAANYQQCTTSSTCVIGEFLYADDYTPLTGQSCTLTAKYPDGTAFLSSQAMTGRSDGWYSYDATIATTTGLYSATICCTPSSGLMCLDKSFEVKSPATTPPTPADIWGYSARTLTSYGTLVNDIWSATTRSLTTFGSLISDTWGHSSRTMTSFGTLVSDLTGIQDSVATPAPDTLQTLLTEQKAQRELLEKLVNAPIISLSLDEGDTIPDLESKLEESKKQAGILYDQISSAKSRLLVLDSKWDRLSDSAIASEISSLSAVFQNSPPLANLTKSWNTKTITTLSDKMGDLGSTLAALLTTSDLNKARVVPPALLTGLTILSDLENVLGDSTSESSDPTFFGYLAEVDERRTILESENQKIAATLENVNGQGVNNTEREVSAIKSRLLTLNQFPGADSLLNPAKLSSDPHLNLKNILFSLQALVGLNTQILAMNVGDPVRSLWLEEGSIIFRAVITNPSSVISQSVPLKFYLPREVKTQDIITLDPSLSTTYDSVEEALYASGTYELKPKETKVVFVEIEDIWSLSDTEIKTLRTQAANLLKPLEKTAYFSQGTTLKSDIDVTLDKVILSTGKAVTPENKIRAYREAKLELTKVSANMNRLQDLVAQASGTGSVFGFVGGVQTVAVWGIILVVVGGFVFLSRYFKKLNSSPSLHIESPQATREMPPDAEQSGRPPLTTNFQPPTTSPNWHMPALIAAVVVVTAGSTILLTRLAAPPQSPSTVNQIATSPTPIPTPSPTPTPSPEPSDITIQSPKDVLGSNSTTFILTVPEDSSVNIRNKPSADADIVMAIKETQDIHVFKESGDWRQIGFSESDNTKGYWVHSKFISEKK